MTKWILFPFLIFTVHLALAQQTPTDSLALNRAAYHFLNQKISFVQPSGKLENALRQLSSEHAVKFSYSNDKISGVSVKNAVYDSVPLGDLLNKLLLNTGFTYLLVGRMIVLVEEEKHVQEPPVEQPSTVTADTPVSKVQNTPYAKHIYSPSANLSHLSVKDRIKIRTLYFKELRWARSHGNSVTFGTKDSAQQEPSHPEEFIPLSTIDENQYYAAVQIGRVTYKTKMTNNTELNWKTELNYQTTIKPALSLNLKGGIVWRSILIGSGFGHQRFEIQEEARGYFPRGQSGKVDTIIISQTNKFSIFSIPVEALYYKNIHAFFVAAGGGLGVDFIHSKVNTNTFTKYLEVKGKVQSTEESTKKLNTHLIAKVLAGVHLKHKWAITAGVEYSYYLTYFTKNSVYTIYPNAFQFNASLFYFIQRSQIANLIKR